MRDLKKKNKQLLLIKGIFIKEIKIMSRYIGNWIMIITLPYMLAGIFLGVGYAVGGKNASINFYKNTGISDPALYSILGGAIMIATMIILENTGGYIREEQLIGTFELHYLTPNSTLQIWFFHILPIATIMIGIFSITITPILLFKGNLLSFSEWLIAATVIFLSLMPLAGIGLVIAALTVRFKEVWAIVNVINSGITLLSGFYYPLEIFPEMVQTIALLVPSSTAVKILRTIIQHRYTSLNFGPQIILFLVLSMIYLSSGYITYKRWENAARKNGELSKY